MSANQSHYHAIQQQSQPESSLDSTDFTSGGNLTSGHSINLNAQIADSLIVPNLNQIQSSTTSSSKENDEHSFPFKTFIHRGNSADTAEEHQQPLRKQKQHSFVSK